MIFQEVNKLRQEGKLKEAYQMADDALKKDPDNIWNKKAMAWVYYAFLKQNTEPSKFENFRKVLAKIVELGVPASEEMFFEHIAWKVGVMVFELKKAEKIDWEKTNQLLDLTKQFNFPKPSESYSFLFKAFQKKYDQWTRYVEFADWWDFKNFRRENFLTGEYNGERVMSIAEQAYIAYAKKLLEGESVNAYSFEKKNNSDKINSFLEKLSNLIEKHPEYQYPPYYKAKFLLSLGNKEKAFSLFLPFARQKQNNFWIWEIMADFYRNDNEIQLACYCKALSLNTPDEFLVKIRKRFASMLIERQFYSEAKTEINKIIDIRQMKEWKISTQVKQWTNQDWYENTQSKKDNSSFYKEHLMIAEEILFADIPEEIVAIEFVNKNKKIINFIKDKSQHGFFKYLGMIENPEIGDLISVRFSGEGSEGFHKVLTIKKVTSDFPCDAIREFSGVVKMRETANFGFVDDIFIEPKLVVKHELNKNDLIKGKAILSFNKKKNEWGWKAILINKNY